MIHINDIKLALQHVDGIVLIGTNDELQEDLNHEVEIHEIQLEEGHSEEESSLEDKIAWLEAQIAAIPSD